MMRSFIDGFLGALGKLFPRISRYRIEPDVLVSMRELALQTHPKEVIGLLQGDPAGGELRIHTIVFQPFANTVRSATITIDSQVTGIVGSFHSHPGASAEPSKQDLRLFAQHAGIHCIIAEPYTAVHAFDSRGRLLGVHAVPSSTPRSGFRNRRR